MALYATKADFQRLGVHAAALEGLSDAQIEQWLGSACTVAEGYLADRFTLPLVWVFLASQEVTADGAGDAIDIGGVARIRLALDISDPAVGDIEVSHSGTGASVATASGEATSVGAAIFEILTNASDLTPPPTFRYSLDGGDTFSDSLTLDTSGVFEIPDTGLAITFTDASFVDGDTYSFGFGLDLSVSIEHSDDQGDEDPWVEVGAFAVPSPVLENQHLTLSLGGGSVTLKRYIRIAYAISTNSTVTLSVTWDGEDLKQAVCKLAAFEGLSSRGLDINGRDEILETRYNQALGWLKDVRSGKTTPTFLDQKAPDDSLTASYSYSRRRRGWR